MPSISMQRDASPKWIWALITLLGTTGLIYSCFVVSWHRAALLVLLSMLLALTEYFSIQISQLTVTVSLPLLYTMSLVSGFPAAIIITTIVVSLVKWIRHRPLYPAFVRVFSRVCGLLAAWMGTSVLLPVLLPATGGSHRGLGYLEGHLALTVCLFAVVYNALVHWYLYATKDARRNFRLAIWVTLFTMALAFLYVTLMFWIASNPRNTGTGNLGTVFFFFPLVGSAIVAHLMTNLLRTKSGLERVMALSEAMNRHADEDALSKRIIEAALQLVDAEWYALCVRRGDDFQTREMAGSLPFANLSELQNTCVQRIISDPRTTLIPDIAKDLHIQTNSRPRFSIRSLLVAPVLVEGQVTGILILGRTQSRSFRPHEKRMVTIFAAHAGVAMNNAMYMEEREKRLLVEERNRLAREIHDGIAQDLAGVLFQVEAMRRSSESGGRRTLEDIQKRLTQTIAALRDSIFELRPEPYIQVGLVQALADHVRDVQRKHPAVEIRFDVSRGDFPTLVPAVSQAIYSTAVECIQNVMKHANATSVSLELMQFSDAIQLTITDDGVGFHFGHTLMQAAGRQSFGIENLYRMANEVGATLEFETSPGHGTKVVLDVPRKENRQSADSRFALR